MRYGPTEVEAAARSAEELAFLTAIAEDQLEVLRKLVYADWLEERGDPRGQFLRGFVETARDPSAPLPPGDEFPFPWRQVIGVQPRERIRARILAGDVTGSHVDRVERELMRRARPTLYIAVSPAEDKDLPPGCSKFGGRPDMPPGVEWPVFPSTYGHSTSIFCAQIRLSDLRDTVVGRELPAEGLLAFFYLPGGEGPVLLHPEGGPFHRPDPPPDPYWQVTRAKGGFGEEFFPLPAGSMRLIESIDFFIRFDDEESWPEDFYRQNDIFFDDIERDLTPEGIVRNVRVRQLLGNGTPFNAAFPPEDEPGMRRLAVFGSDPDGPHYWGDSGAPIWYISEADLAAGRLENAGFYEG